jgi:protein-tyrosine-phosphatase
VNVLFVCVANSGRSLIAERLLVERAQGRHLARSAGSAPGAAPHPNVLAALLELGIDAADHVPQQLDAGALAWADVAVSTCSEEVCPVTPGVRRIGWSFDDPKDLPLERVRGIRDEIAAAVAGLVAELDAATSWTSFPDLDELLAEVVARVQAILGDDFVGAYLTGSFALGAGDIHSDCDFLVVTERRVTAAQERELRALHDEIPTRPGHWPHDLEGSYAPRGDLAAFDALGEEWPYVDRGHRELQWSTHCNVEDVRWTLRERGITLAGPPPRELVAEVPPDALRERARGLIDSFLPDLAQWIALDTAWAQRYAVAGLCRLLYTAETGKVASKPGALRWGKRTLPVEWHGLIQQVLDDRALGWRPDEEPRPGSVEATLALAEYAKRRAER